MTQATQKLSPKAVEEFRLLYASKFNCTISYENAERDLINLMRIVSAAKAENK